MYTFLVGFALCVDLLSSVGFVLCVHFLLSSFLFPLGFALCTYLDLIWQAALGESKKSDNALMYVKVDDQKLAIGTLSIDKFPQVQFDLVFDKEFELSHTSKTTSVFFSGYKVEQPMEEDEYPFWC